MAGEQTIRGSSSQAAVRGRGSSRGAPCRRGGRVAAVVSRPIEKKTVAPTATTKASSSARGGRTIAVAQHQRKRERPASPDRPKKVTKSSREAAATNVAEAEAVVVPFAKEPLSEVVTLAVAPRPSAEVKTAAVASGAAITVDVGGSAASVPATTDVVCSGAVIDDSAATGGGQQAEATEVFPEATIRAATPLTPLSAGGRELEEITDAADIERVRRLAHEKNLKAPTVDDQTGAASHLDGGTAANQESSINIQLPRRSLLVQFTCDACGEKTKRLINRLAYERGTVFVQCAGCLRHHKLVDNLGLVVEYDFRNEE